MESPVDDNFSIEIVRGGDANVSRFTIVEQDTVSPPPLPTEELETYEQIEHVCGGCGKVYKNVTCLKKHFMICGTGKPLKPPKEKKNKRQRKRVQSTEEYGVEGNEDQPTDNEILTVDPIDEDEEIDDDDGNVQIQTFNDLDEESCHCCDEPLSKAHKGHIKCNFCTRKFHTYIGADKHLTNMHNSSELFKCPKCPAQCPDEAMLEQHLINHADFVCSKCSKEFTRQYHLDRHVEKSECMMDDPEKQKTACHACGKKFLRLDNLREHLRSHVGTNYRRRDHHCETCGKSFYALSMLQIHIRSHTNERPFACDLCEKAFPSNGALRKHRRVHTGEKPYSCSLCEGRYAAKETLNRHMKTHTGVKNHKCELCDKAFIQRTQLKNHLRVYHAAKGIQCPYCPDSLESKLMLKRHVIKFHNKAELQCPECDDIFPTEDSLSRHYELKHSNKVFFCGECCLNFTTKAELFEHNTAQHAHQKRPTCVFCGKVYKMQHSLTQHIEREHAGQEPPTEEVVITPAPKRKVGRPRKNQDEELSEAIKSPPKARKMENILKENFNFLIFTENVPLRMPKKEYASGHELKMALKGIIVGLINEETLKTINWPNCDVEGALTHLLKLLNATPAQDDEGTLRNGIMALLGRFIGKRSLNRMINNYTTDEIINYLAASVSKANLPPGERSPGKSRT